MRHIQSQLFPSHYHITYTEPQMYQWVDHISLDVQRVVKWTHVFISFIQSCVEQTGIHSRNNCVCQGDIFKCDIMWTILHTDIRYELSNMQKYKKLEGGKYFFTAQFPYDFIFNYVVYLRSVSDVSSYNILLINYL